MPANEETSPPKFNRLTPDNWAEPDELSKQFARIDPVRQVAMKMDGQAWAEEFLAVELSGNVPEDIIDMSDIAKGMMVYGWFFTRSTSRAMMHCTAWSTLLQKLAWCNSRRTRSPDL